MKLKYPALILGSCLITILFAVSIQGQRGRFNPDGSFWIIGDAPPSFRNFGGINLNSNRNRRLPGAGVDLTDGSRIKFKMLSVSRARLTFATANLRGVAYSFSGRFLRGGVFAAQDLEEKTVLEGVLKKLSGGKVVAEARLSFSYFGGT